MRSILLLALMIPGLLLSSCGGSGSGASAEPSEQGQLRGSRTVPLGTVEVRQTSNGFLMTSSVPSIASAAVLVGIDYESATSVALTSAGVGAWRGVAASGATLLVRLTLADGAIIETAAGDFVLQ